MGPDDIAALTRLLRRSTPPQHAAFEVRAILGLDDAYEGLLDRMLAIRQAHDARAHDAAALQRALEPHGRQLLAIDRQVDAWLLQRLCAGDWIAFGVPVPLAREPMQMPLTQAQWMAMALDHRQARAQGGGRTYERIQLVDLADLPGREANGVRDLMQRLARARREEDLRERALGPGIGAAMVREIARATGQELADRISVAGDPDRPVHVVYAGSVPGVHMPVDLEGVRAGLELTVVPPPRQSSPRSPQPPPRPLVPQEAGEAGRPSLVHLVDPELERRAAAGEMHPYVKGEAKYLAAWLNRQPEVKRRKLPAAEGTVENHIRNRHRELKAGRASRIHSVDK